MSKARVVINSDATIDESDDPAIAMMDKTIDILTTQHGSTNNVNCNLDCYAGRGEL